jgi:hypothetical protein
MSVRLVAIALIPLGCAFALLALFLRPPEPQVPVKPLPGTQGAPLRDLAEDQSRRESPDARGPLTGPTTVPQDEAVPTEEKVTEEDFKWQRATTDLETLAQERRDLDAEIAALCAQDAMARIEDGEYEVVATSKDGSIPMREGRRHIIEFYSTNEDGQTIRAVMPPAKYEQAYDVRQKQLWLTDLIDERRAIAAGRPWPSQDGR